MLPGAIAFGAYLGCVWCLISFTARGLLHQDALEVPCSFRFRSLLRVQADPLRKLHVANLRTGVAGLVVLRHVDLDTSRCRRTPWMPNINHPAALGHQWPGPWPARQLRFRSPGFSHLWSEPMTRSHKCFGSGVLGDSRCCSLLVPWTPSGFREQWSRGVRWTSSS